MFPEPFVYAHCQIELPLEDGGDATSIFSRKFRGFKLNAAVNQLGLLLKAKVTSGNKYDLPFLLILIEDLSEVHLPKFYGSFISSKDYSQ